MQFRNLEKSNIDRLFALKELLIEAQQEKIKVYEQGILKITSVQIGSYNICLN